MGKGVTMGLGMDGRGLRTSGESTFSHGRNIFRFLVAFAMGAIFGLLPSHAEEPQEAIRRYRSANPEERIRMLESLREASSSLHDDPIEESTSDAGANAKPAGGASLANFDTLIQLIQSTIDGNWISEGGNSQIVPFHNGVRISTEGLIERVAPQDDDAMLEKAKRLGEMRWEGLGEWQKPSELRWVSLHQIDRMLNQQRSTQQLSKIELELLGGLVRIDYLAWDSAAKEWLIGGPAGNLIPNAEGELVHQELHLPPVLLEDLITIAPHVLNRGGAFGCSIDPDTVRLQQAYDYALQPGVRRSLQRAPDRWIENWRKLLGPQNTTIYGLPAASPTAFALLKADAEMKMLGLGLLPLPPSIQSYWHQAELLQSRSPHGMVRWWFTLHSTRIPHDREQVIYKISVQNVRVLSESQFINEQGDRVVSNLPDLAADAFASQFTKHHEELQRRSTVQARLRHIFDLAVVFELVRSEQEQGRGDAFLCLNDHSIQPRMPRIPLQIESIASAHRMKDGTQFAVISGGVSVRPTESPKRLSTGTLKRTLLMGRDQEFNTSFWKEETPSRPNPSRE